jgi:hypothetical protein
MPTITHQPPAKPAPSDDPELDEALKETFPASDPIEAPSHEKLPPAHAPGSDVDNR